MLLELMRTDGQSFYAQVCPTNEGPDLYAWIPVLASIPPEKFVEVWLSSPRPYWRSISNALEDRFRRAQTHEDLAGEKEWGIKVLQLLEEAADQAKGFEALRIRRTIPDNLRDFQKNNKEAAG